LQLAEPLARVVSEFSAWETERGDKPRTIEAYLRNTREFLLCGPTPATTLTEVTLERVESYVHFCVESRSEATLYTKLSSIRVFLRFLWEAGHLDNDLSAQFVLPSPVKRWPAYLSRAQEDRLVCLIDDYESPKKRRVRAAVELLLHGPKVNELVALNVSDIESSGKFNLGSENKRRTIYLHERSWRALVDYLEVREESVTCGQPDGEALFLSRQGKRVSHRWIQRQLETLGLQVGFELTAEILRNTFAIKLCRGGAPLDTLHYFLGYEREFSVWKFIWTISREEKGQMPADRKWVAKNVKNLFKVQRAEEGER